MDRGLRAQLSPREETALRKIAGGAAVDQIQLAHLKQLVALQLVEERDGRWGLTAMGRTRITFSERGVGAPFRFPATVTPRSQ